MIWNEVRTEGCSLADGNVRKWTVSVLMAGHRLREPEHESRSGGGSRSRRDGEERILGGRASARRRLRGHPSGLEARVRGMGSEGSGRGNNPIGGVGPGLYQ